MTQHALRPSSDTRRVVKLANTPCPTRSAASVLALLTLNWKTFPFAAILPETMPLAVSIAVMEQQAGVCAEA